MQRPPLWALMFHRAGHGRYRGTTSRVPLWPDSGIRGFMGLLVIVVWLIAHIFNNDTWLFFRLSKLYLPATISDSTHLIFSLSLS